MYSSRYDYWLPSILKYCLSFYVCSCLGCEDALQSHVLFNKMNRSISCATGYHFDSDNLVFQCGYGKWIVDSNSIKCTSAQTVIKPTCEF